MSIHPILNLVIQEIRYKPTLKDPCASKAGALFVKLLTEEDLIFSFGKTKHPLSM